MSDENSEILPQLDNKLSRRQLFQETASEIKRQLTPENSKITTPTANYYPQKEIHPIRPTLDEITRLPHIDLQFLENATSDNDYPNNISLAEILSAPNQYGVPTFSPEIINYYTQQKTLFSLENYNYSPRQEMISNLMEYSRLVLGLFISMPVGTESFSTFLSKLKGKQSDMSRRKFLGLSLGTTAVTWLISPTATAYLTNVAYVEKEGKNEILNNIADRASALSSHAHLEDFTLFARNLFMARKLQALGTYLNSQNGEKPNIAYRVGAAHSGIEDYLNLGEDITLGLVSLLPPDYLRFIIEENGGLDNLCSSSIIPIITPNENSLDKPHIKIIDNQLKQVIAERINPKPNL